jgi:hypothetical protein
MHMASEIAQNGREEATAQDAAPGAPPSRESEGYGASPTPPTVESPPTSPQHSPWWTAPAGKAVNIPDFGHVFAPLRDALLALFAPAPQPIPIRIRARR